MDIYKLLLLWLSIIWHTAEILQYQQHRNNVNLLAGTTESAARDD